MKEIIVGKNITKNFSGVQALKGVDMTIRAGEIRALVGENGCGKSTFVKIISGVHAPSGGTITIDDKVYSKLTTLGAINAGIQVIYQDLSLFNHLSVAENIAINRLLRDGKRFVNMKAMRAIAAQQLDRIGISLDLDTQASNLSVANRQLVAICRSLALDARVLFMDEPTTALTSREVARLLKIVEELKARGLAVVFISHKLGEIFKVADVITVLRDGLKVGDFEPSALTPKSLSHYMTGRDVSYGEYTPENGVRDELISVANLTKKNNYSNVSFALRQGDILGFTGLLGSGRTELALSLFGLTQPDSGEIKVAGKKVRIKSPQSATELGIALLPEDRHAQGLFIRQSMKTNISASILPKLKNKLGIINARREHEIAQETVDRVKVNNRDVDTEAGNLSGGNQQKVVLGKWMATSPKIFILDTPTVGIDIGSKSEIYDMARELARRGMGIIFISDEIDEILANCNRVIVMSEGAIKAEFKGSELNEQNLTAAVGT